MVWRLFQFTPLVAEVEDIKTQMEDKCLLVNPSPKSKCVAIVDSRKEDVYTITSEDHIEQRGGDGHELDTGTRCVQSMACVTSLLFFLCGNALVLLGVFLHLSVKSPTSSRHQDSGYSYIVVGVAIGVTVSGVFLHILYCITKKKHSCQRKELHLTVSLITLTACFTAFVINHIVKSRVRYVWLAPWLYSLIAFDPTNPTASPVDWNELQLREHCCGLNNYTDWKLHEIYALSPDTLPWSCCGSTDVTSTCFEKDAQYKSTGCIESLAQPIERNLLFGGAIIGAMTLLQLLDIILVYILHTRKNAASKSRSSSEHAVEQEIGCGERTDSGSKVCSCHLSKEIMVIGDLKAPHIQIKSVQTD